MLSPGDRLGRYEVVSPLGAGGMGEVYRARDTELEREVALKVLPESVSSDPDRLRRFEREAKAVAALNHPNVLTVHDVGTDGGTAYLVSELLEGETLREHVSRHKVLPARAVEIALEVAGGLDAAHEKGIVHRDVKPANVFVARDGRVKVLDFGLAKAGAPGSAGSEVKTETRHDEEDTSPGQLLGTVGYMSPEQVRGLALDGRSDVFSLGVVLYELLTRIHPFRRATEIATLTALLEEEPADVASVGSGVSPAVGGIVRRCLAKDRKERYGTCRELIAALETALERPGRAVRTELPEERSPYPGLSSFGEADADRFFGREGEVEALWGRLRNRRLLAVIGPSGAGKTSFVRAGVVASRPSGWAALVCTPGARPLRNLGQALAPEVSSDADALRKLVGLEDTATAFELLEQWRKGHGDAVLVLDQFEELFTLNGPETQAELTELLSRVAHDADIHVLLSLRDDFLIRCSEHAALAPVFSELTPMPPLVGDALRRAVVEPASREGYRFEDDALVEEMLEAVEGARGALPLLAFAVSRLWEKRDQEKKVLTRAAYEEMGGVAGALAQHAEGVLERIGMVRQGLVREMFRNLVTAQGTRAVVEREELLSVFPEREAAEQVLETLIDARLLTSYESVEPASSRETRSEAGDGGSAGASSGERTVHRIEVVHESLLKAWPRLVMWQAQEEEGAVLRDQLKQAAHLWDEKGRSAELVWTGRAYLEYRAWRSRYEGGLSAVEEDFARAMATVAGRRRRQRRLAAAAALVVLSLGLAVVSVFWARAKAEARRAEANRLLTLGEAELERYPTGALAYAMKSLELSDSEGARRLALRILQRAPVARIAPSPGNVDDGGGAMGLDFSPDGQWVATGGNVRADVLHRDGDWRLALGGFRPTAIGTGVRFGPESDVLLANKTGQIRVWSLPEGRELRREELGSDTSAFIGQEGFLTARAVDGEAVLQSWPFGEGEPLLLGSMEPAQVASVRGTRMAYSQGSAVYVRSLDDWGAPPRRVAEHASDVEAVALSWDGSRLAVSDAAGEARIWPIDRPGSAPERVLSVPGTPWPQFDPTGRWLSLDGAIEGQPTIRVFDLEAPPGIEPVVLQRSIFFMNELAFDARGQWLASAHAQDVALWYLGDARARVWRGQANALVFTPDGRRLVSVDGEGTVEIRPLSRHEEPHVAYRGRAANGLAVDPTGDHVLLSGNEGIVLLVSLDGGPVRRLEGFSRDTQLSAVAFDGTGRRAAAASIFGPREEKVVRVWDLVSGETQVLGPVPGAGDAFQGGARGMSGLAFVGDDRILVAAEDSGVVSFDLNTGEGTLVASRPNRHFLLASDRTFGIGWHFTGTDAMGKMSWMTDVECLRFEVDGSPPTVLNGYSGWGPGALDPSGRLLAVANPLDGTIRLGAVAGGEPHLLLGHDGGGMGAALAFSPDGRWLASAAGDTIRLWPVPDVSKTPLHRRPLEDVLRVLRSHTNLRAVPDPGSPRGYTLEPGPFPGWAEPPEW